MNRTVKIKKAKLLIALENNKTAHIEDYNKAVIAYKEEALKQLAELKDEVEDGSLNIRLELVTPINNTETYNENIKLFEWEIKDEVELTKDEFEEFVLDKSHYSAQILMSNSTYR